MSRNIIESQVPGIIIPLYCHSPNTGMGSKRDDTGEETLDQTVTLPVLPSVHCRQEIGDWNLEEEVFLKKGKDLSSEKSGAVMILPCPV